MVLNILLYFRIVCYIFSLVRNYTISCLYTIENLRVLVILWICYLQGEMKNQLKSNFVGITLAAAQLLLCTAAWLKAAHSAC